MPLVGVIVGSKSDRPLIDETSEVLDQLGVEHEVVVASAHRTPEAVMEWATSARERGIEVIIAAAGGSAGLPGVVASWTTLPVIGVPVPSSDLEGIDSLYSIARCRPVFPSRAWQSAHGERGTPHSSLRRYSASSTTACERRTTSTARD